MDKLRGKNSSKQTKSSKKKPVKVVYISNPMKVKTSASDFRALVQELTGQDSDIADASSRYSEMDCVDDDHHQGVTRTVSSNEEGMMMEISNENGGIKEETTRVDPLKSLDSSFEQFEPFDQVNFSSYMQDNGFTPSGLLYDVPARTLIKKP